MWEQMFENARGVFSSSRLLCVPEWTDFWRRPRRSTLYLFLCSLTNEENGVPSSVRAYCKINVSLFCGQWGQSFVVNGFVFYSSQQKTQTSTEHIYIYIYIYLYNTTTVYNLPHIQCHVRCGPFARANRAVRLNGVVFHL